MEGPQELINESVSKEKVPDRHWVVRKIGKNKHEEGAKWG